MVNNDTSFPPHRNHTSSRISPTEALSLITVYLEKSETDSSLHPNAILSESGPTVPYSATSTGLVMHNLKRLQAGLRGEHIATDIEAENLTNGVTALPKATGKGTTTNNEADMEFDWQNMSEFERDERDVEESMGPGPTGSGIMDERDEQRVLQFSNTAQSKQDKKHAKRARKHEQKRAREEQRAAAAVDAEGEDEGDDGDESST